MSAKAVDKNYLISQLKMYDEALKQSIKPKKTNCPNCGAILKSNKCEYCGSIF